MSSLVCCDDAGPNRTGGGNEPRREPLTGLRRDPEWDRREGGTRAARWGAAENGRDRVPVHEAVVGTQAGTR